MLRRTLHAVLAFALYSSSAAAQDAPGYPAVTKDHQWLHQFVGEWETQGEAHMGPGQPAIKSSGTMKARMLGERWLISEVKFEMMGTEDAAVQTIGYDPKAKRYVGTWVDSMTNHLWKYEGTVDKTGKVLTLEAEGPNFMVEGKLTMFRDIYEFKSKDLIATSSQMQLDDGKWVTFMTGSAKRKGT